MSNQDTNERIAPRSSGTSNDEASRERSTWDLINSPIVVTFTAFILTVVLGGIVNMYIKSYNSNQLSTVQHREQKHATQELVRTQLINTLTNRVSHIDLIFNDLGRRNGAEELNRDWLVYKADYLLATPAIWKGNMALAVELRPLGPKISGIFSSFLLNNLDRDLYNMDVCLSWARDEYLAAGPNGDRMVSGAAGRIAACANNGVNWDNIRVCIQDMLIQIDDAENVSENVSHSDDINILALERGYMDVLSKIGSCGPIRRDES
jgi:hypothetical protein